MKMKITGSGGSATAQFTDVRYQGYAEIDHRCNHCGRFKGEQGWLIERSHALGGPKYLFAGWSFEWTSDPLKAIRFSRREDAEQIASMLETEEVSITEHQWL